MIDQARKLLQDIYGYADFRGPQADVIAAVLAGRDCLVLMPTGGGKSLCYQLPALVREGTAIIVSPLIALMQDQVQALHLLGVEAAFLNSTLDAGMQQQIERRVVMGDLKLLYIAPERLVQERTLALLQQAPISLIAIDEAHCVSQWGHDFRQDYLGLDVLVERFPNVPRMALTATADERTREEIGIRLKLDNPLRFVSGFDRPNIRYSVQIKTNARRQLLNFLITHRGSAGIVYCMSRNKVEQIAAWLREQSLEALPYHAGLRAAQRATHQQRFLREDGIIMVATIAFGMGIDKPDVRFVAHLDLPKSLEAYYQETGRAGRDGEPAEAWMIYGLQDVVRVRQMLEQSQANEAQKRIERHKLNALLGWCETTSCRRQGLLHYFGEQTAGGCNYCDTCLTPPRTWDATQAAQKLLSCVYRSGQRFGAGHLIDILRGKTTDKVLQYRHQELSTFGIGADISEQQWQSLIRQLMVQGVLYADLESFGALRLTDNSRAVLRGESQLRLREDTQVKTALSAARKSAQPISDQPLWEALKQCRKQLAEQYAVPPFVVFHDATLLDMLEQQPRSMGELLNVHGVGQAKLEKYGEAFLAVIRDHPASDVY